MNEQNLLSRPLVYWSLSEFKMLLFWAGGGWTSV